jgi:DNA-binding Lrp family transcriptional regulator
VNIELDQIDRILVNLMQSDFPLTRDPFAELASQLGLNEQEVLERAEQLREKRIIRIIGPVFNSRALGYQSTLVAMRVPEERIEQAARIISEHQGVGHNYQRDHHYNLWFTLAIRGDADLKEALNEFNQKIQPEAMLDLPATKLFKIRLFFDLEGNGNNSDDTLTTEPQPVSVPLSDLERSVINEVQQQLKLVTRPFDSMAQNAGMESEDFLAVCRSLQERSIMRRFGASIEHQNAGFTANSMVCWVVPQDRVDEVGQKMAKFKEVTHCYERKTSREWPRYNVFTMIHGNTNEQNKDTIARMSHDTGISEYEILSTVREFKKERVKYRV